MVKHTQTIRRPLPTNCLSVFDHSVGLALKELSHSIKKFALKSISSKFFYSELRNYLDNFILLIVTLIPFIITKTCDSCNVFLTVSFPKRTSTYGRASIIGLSNNSHTNGADRFIMQTYKQNICARKFVK